jgi:hypothetical protein
MNIGVIVKTDKKAEELSTDWVPEALGSKHFVYGCLEAVLEQSVNKDKFTFDKNGALIHFTVEEEKEPRAITVSYGSGLKELEIIRNICRKLGAKLYDSESCDFVWQ